MALFKKMKETAGLAKGWAKQASDRQEPKGPRVDDETPLGLKMGYRISFRDSFASTLRVRNPLIRLPEVTEMMIIGYSTVRFDQLQKERKLFRFYLASEGIEKYLEIFAKRVGDIWEPLGIWYASTLDAWTPDDAERRTYEGKIEGEGPGHQPLVYTIDQLAELTGQPSRVLEVVLSPSDDGKVRWEIPQGDDPAPEHGYEIRTDDPYGSMGLKTEIFSHQLFQGENGIRVTCERALDQSGQVHACEIEIDARVALEKGDFQIFPC